MQRGGLAAAHRSCPRHGHRAQPKGTANCGAIIHVSPSPPAPPSPPPFCASPKQRTNLCKRTVSGAVPVECLERNGLSGL